MDPVWQLAHLFFKAPIPMLRNYAVSPETAEIEVTLKLHHFPMDFLQ